MLKIITKIDYLLRETFLGIKRGGSMNWAAISTVTVLLFLFGICLQTSWQLDSLLNHFGTQVEVSVYLEPEAEAEQLLSLVDKLPQVKSVTMISKEQAWTSLLKDMGIFEWEQATEQLEGNPLVDELKVSVINAEVVSEVAQNLGQLPGVHEVQ
ncbi:MAG: ABC transporter permease, partial [Moorea sp. SIO2B7]|nr:ABC transporter permease [Moorena sp. SIO2B7]